MSKRNKLLAFGGGAVGLVLLIIIAASANRPSGVEVRLEQVSRRDLVATVTASGKIQPKRRVDVSADIATPGRIVQLSVHEGDYVREGQFLLQIDPTIFQANLERAQAALASAQAVLVQAQASRDQAVRALARAKELRESNPNLISPEALEQAQTASDIASANFNAAEHSVDQGRAGVSEARDQLRKTRILAPMSGRVTRLAVEEGEVAVPGTFSRETGLLLTISDLSVILARVQVDETDVVRLHLGDSVEVSIDAFPDTNFTGHVTKVSNSAIQGAGTAGSNIPGSTDRAVDYEVEVTLDHPPSDVRPDLSATARIVTDTRRNALSIPIISLTVREHTPVSTENRPADTTSSKHETEGVFVVSNGVATFRPVKVGIAGEEHFEVLDGLKDTDTLVAGPYQSIRDLKDGTRVRQLPQTGTDTARARSGS